MVHEAEALFEGDREGDEQEEAYNSSGREAGEDQEQAEISEDQALQG